MIPAIRFGPGGGGAVSSTAVVISLCIIELMINNQTIEDKKNSLFLYAEQTASLETQVQVLQNIDRKQYETNKQTKLTLWIFVKAYQSVSELKWCFFNKKKNKKTNQMQQRQQLLPAQNVKTRKLAKQEPTTVAKPEQQSL